MTDQAPIDAKDVARILRRAGDLERTGDVKDEAGTIAEASLIAAAEEVGLSVDAVRRSIAVERLGPLPAARLGDRIVGPSQVYADGEVDVSAVDALARVDSWLVDGHHLRRDVLRPGTGSGANARASSAPPYGPFAARQARASWETSNESMPRPAIREAVHRWSGSRSTERPIGDSRAAVGRSLPLAGCPGSWWPQWR